MSRRRRLIPLAVAVVGLILGTTSANGTPPGQSVPVNTAAPSISGSVAQGQTLSASPGTWSGPSPSFVFQWERCGAGGAACTPIAGATGASYTAGSADVGAAFVVAVTATNKNGSSIATSDATSVVAAPAPTPPPTTPSTTTTTRTTTTTPTATTTTSTTPTTTTTPTATTTTTSTTPTTPTTTTTTTTTATPATASGTGLFTLDYATSGLSSWQNTSQYQWLVVNNDFSSVNVNQTWAGSAGNGLTYVDAEGVRQNNVYGMDYATASANGWLERTSAGTPVTIFGSSTYFVWDVGNANARQRWITNTLAYLARIPGIKGVMIDDVFPSIKGQTDGGAVPALPANYSSDSTWQSAMLGFVQTVGQALHAHGYRVVVNATGYINDSNYDNGLFDQSWFASLAKTGGVDGILYEYWMQNPNTLTNLRNNTSTVYPGFFANWLDLTDVCNQYGVDFMPVMYGSSTTVSTMRYGRGAFLLEWDGSHGAYAFGNLSADLSNAAWTANIGTPTAAKSQPAPGVYYRPFKNGWVLVNSTTSSTIQTVNGVSYTVGPTDALIHQGA